MGWKTKLQKAKQLHRPSLKDWECDRLYEENKFPSFVKHLQNTPSELYKTFYVERQREQESQQVNHCGKEEVIQPSAESSSVSSSSTTNLDDTHHDHPIPQLVRQLPVILDAKVLTTHVFHTQYECMNIPCIIQNIPNGYDNATSTGQPWPATKHWGQCVPLQLEHYHTNTPLRERLFKCGEDDYGKTIKVRLKYFLKYMYYNHDDSPLYIFDSSFEKDVHAKSLLQDYIVPSYFQNDLFNYISEKRRPPYRWILIGPQRSGSCIHIDPLSTNAWNTLLHGQKRWVLFPPHVPKYIVKGKGLIGPKEDDEAIHYFMYILPRIKRRAQQILHEQPNHPDYNNFICYEFTQHSNETVFVPHGWWHAVLNITNTIGVTQNYAASCNMNDIWIKVRKDRPRMAYKLLQQLQNHEPYLYQQAIILNERDQFRMKYDPLVIQERHHHYHGKGRTNDTGKGGKKQKCYV